MFDLFIELTTKYGFGVVLIIFIVCAACTLKIIGFCKDLWAKRKKFADVNIEKGKAIEAKEEADALKVVS